MRTLRADLIGSMPRPAALIEAQARHDRGTLSDDAFRRMVDEAIRELIAAEEAHGPPVVTDGECRRHNRRRVSGVGCGASAPTPDPRFPKPWGGV